MSHKADNAAGRLVESVEPPRTIRPETGLAGRPGPRWRLAALHGLQGGTTLHWGGWDIDRTRGSGQKDTGSALVRQVPGMLLAPSPRGHKRETATWFQEGDNGREREGGHRNRG